MDKQDANTVVKVYSIIYYVLGALWILGLLFMGAFGDMMNRIGFTGNFMPPFSMAFFGIGIFMIIGAILMIIAGKLISDRKENGRILAIVVNILLLFSFPIGTLIGGFGIYFFAFKREVIHLFR
ncbi:MAG: hypothetical protein AABW87_02245 [Nanoarchaeota archaeon]